MSSDLVKGASHTGHLTSIVDHRYPVTTVVQRNAMDNIRIIVSLYLIFPKTEMLSWIYFEKLYDWVSPGFQGKMFTIPRKVHYN